MNRQKEIGFIRGVAYCVALDEREFGTGEFILSESGITLKDCKKAKVDEYDLKEIVKILSENTKGRKDNGK